MTATTFERLLSTGTAGYAEARDSSPLLTVIIPVYNEAATIRESVERVLAAPYEKQVIIVNDASTDGTDIVLREFSAQPNVLVLTHPANFGKGRAIRTALAHATGRFTIIQDADLEYDPQDYADVVTPLLSGESQVVFGSRYLTGGNRSGGMFFRLGVSVLNWLVRFIYGAKLTDEATCYKAMSTALLSAMRLECERFEFCPEVTAKLCRLGIAIHEVPISYFPRGTSAGKKIRWRDGIQAMRTLWRWRKWTRDGYLDSVPMTADSLKSIGVSAGIRD
jgi:dolichol-phosphate mannosyltransferase